MQKTACDSRESAMSTTHVDSFIRHLAAQQMCTMMHHSLCWEMQEGTPGAWQAVRRECDGRSLVLLDEVGTGTDPVEGAALGAAVLKALADGGARGAALTLATTHHRSVISSQSSRRVQAEWATNVSCCMASAPAAF